MPEMLAYCGRTMSVFKTAAKTCDGAGTVREMDDAVFRTGVRSDGSAHGGCQAACLIHWKAAWIEPVDPSVVVGSDGAREDTGAVDRGFVDRVAPTTKPGAGDGTVYHARPPRSSLRRGRCHRGGLASTSMTCGTGGSP